MLNLEALDQGAQHPFRHLQRDGLRQAMVVVTYLGEVYVILAILLVACLLFVQRDRLRQAMTLSLITLSAVGLTYLTKYVVDRPRPNIGWSPLPMPDSPSFPSGHALNAAALYGTLSILLARAMLPGFRRRLVLYAGILTPFVIGVSRMYIGHNYVTDVLAGWIAGTALALIGGWLDESDAPTDLARPGGSAL